MPISIVDLLPQSGAPEAPPDSAPLARREVSPESPATAPVEPAIVERVLIHGDLRQLSPAQKVSYYKAVCESMGLNPLTRPFEYIVLNGKETLYAKRDATDQLRNVHHVSVQIIAREVTEDCYVVTARATMPNGRQDESIGAVPIATLKGEVRANAMMKCETKAKRRVTLSICGLGILDETEVESITSGGPRCYIVTAPSAVAMSEVGAGPSVPNGGDSGHSDDDGAAASRATALLPILVPVGYVEWLHDLYACADEGTTKLQAMWTASKKEFRQHLTTTAAKEWEAIKTRAAAVKGAK